MSDNAHYDFIDVFGEDQFYYSGSTTRIVARETPISIIYMDNNLIKIRFKKDFFDKYDTYLEDYLGGLLIYKLKDEKTKYSIRIRHAIYNYRTEDNVFSISVIHPNDLSKKLDKCLEYEYVFGESFNVDFFSSQTYWFPVDVDTIVFDYKICGGAMMLSCYDDVRCGILGFDAHFYENDVVPQVYSIKNGVSTAKVPEWAANKVYPFLSATFLKDCIITADNERYGYDGRPLCIHE